MRIERFSLEPRSLAVHSCQEQATFHLHSSVVFVVDRGLLPNDEGRRTSYAWSVLNLQGPPLLFR